MYNTKHYHIRRSYTRDAVKRTRWSDVWMSSTWWSHSHDV